MTGELAPREQDTTALRLDVPDGADPADLRLAGLAIAVLGGLADEGIRRPLPLPVPVYVRLRRQLIRSGKISGDTVPHWPAGDW